MSTPPTEPLACYLDGLAVKTDVFIGLQQTRAWNRGVFETMRWTGHALPLWSMHRERLERGLAQQGLILPEPADPAGVIRRSFAGQPCRIRLTVLPATAQALSLLPADTRRHYPGIETAGLTVLSIHPLPETRHSVRLLTATEPHPFTEASHSSVKSNNRAYYDTCFNYAREQGFDDGILYDDRGYVSETCIANLLMLRGGILCTPDPSTNPLQGVGLRWLAAHTTRETNPEPVLLTARALCASDGVWIINALRGIVAVRTIRTHDTELTMRENPGLTRKLQAIFPF